MIEQFATLQQTSDFLDKLERRGVHAAVALTERGFEVIWEEDCAGEPAIAESNGTIPHEQIFGPCRRSNADRETEAL